MRAIEFVYERYAIGNGRVEFMALAKARLERIEVVDKRAIAVFRPEW